MKDKVLYCYYDEEDKLQGPFNAHNMQVWFEQGYITNNLEIIAIKSIAHFFIGDLIARNGSRNPFMWRDDGNEDSEEKQQEQSRRRREVREVSSQTNAILSGKKNKETQTNKVKENAVNTSVPYAAVVPIVSVQQPIKTPNLVPINKPPAVKAKTQQKIDIAPPNMPFYKGVGANGSHAWMTREELNICLTKLRAELNNLGKRDRSHYTKICGRLNSAFQLKKTFTVACNCFKKPQQFTTAISAIEHFISKKHINKVLEGGRVFLKFDYTILQSIIVDTAPNDWKEPS